ncbi:hypothetical protein [Pontibacter indicus]|uniref:Uncharacterized protein n=1 Tax=Pontibacter indicus TaxID=1317125 RepID=A0A1R3WL16_9BACT|nr:hypothetical protein [Pontibacter indicus]SIT77313.1 hypothetical protein SAMN05444128_0471 [Pontibacter indicus]
MEIFIILTVLASYAVGYLLYYMYGKEEQKGRNYDRYQKYDRYQV